MSQRFAPESIDREIEALLSEDASGYDARLTHALATLYVPPNEVDTALERVHTRLRNEFDSMSSPGRLLGRSTQHVPDAGDDPTPSTTLSTGQASYSRGRGRHVMRKMPTALGAIAAILLVAVITGSFLYAFQSRGRVPGVPAQATATIVRLLGTPTPLPVPTPSSVATTAAPPPVATTTPRPAARCPTSTGDLSKIRPGGMGASPDTFASVWGPEDGSPGPGSTYYFGRYPDSGIDKIFAQDGAVDRIYGMDYRADTSQNLTLQQAAQIVNSQILPADAGQLTFPHPGGTHMTVQYCSPAFAAAFPASTGVPPTGFIWVTYYFRSNGDVDHVHVSPTSYVP